jgi:peptidoglycan hydrolase-like protein with peptidoglycan-binding domain
MVRAPGPVIAALALLGCLVGTAGPAVAAGSDKASRLPAPTKDVEVPDAPDLDDSSYRDLVTDAQRLLKLRGFDPGPVDGQIGVRTRRAMRAYQADVRTRGVAQALGEPPPEHKAIEPAAGGD